MSAPLLCTLSPGQEVEGTYLLSQVRLLTTKNGKPYGALRLGDQGGELEARLWERAEELLTPLKAGDVVRVGGRTEEFNGKTQISLVAIAADPEADPAQFLPRSPVPAEELEKQLKKALAQVENPLLKRLLKAIFVDDKGFRREFLRAPAAKSAHHACVGGLAEHSLSLAGMAARVAGHYPEQISKDLLVAGALLHDIGKTRELTLGPPLDYTDQGRLEGHLVLGARMLDGYVGAIKGFPPELAGRLRHLILSHHGSREFGSPTLPMTPEAFVLHLIDDMDAKLAMFREEALAHDPAQGHWSGFNRLLERFIFLGPDPLREPGERAEENPAAPGPPGLFDQMGCKGE